MLYCNVQRKWLNEYKKKKEERKITCFELNFTKFPKEKAQHKCLLGKI